MTTTKIQTSQKYKILALLMILAAALPALYSFLPVGIDWHNTYRPAALALLAGKSPYSVEIYYAAPWALLPLIPFAVLPYEIGRTGVFILGLVCFAFTAYKLGAKPPAMILFLASAAVIGCLANGNIEWMALLGIAFPPEWGLILLAIKPQVGVGIGLYWLVTIWKDKGFREVIRVFSPISFLLAISFLLYGLWPLRFGQTLAWSMDNTSLGLYGLALGGIMLTRAILKRSDRMALAAGPLLSPYSLQFTWAAVLIYLFDHPFELLAAVILFWIPVFVRIFG